MSRKVDIKQDDFVLKIRLYQTPEWQDYFYCLKKTKNFFSPHYKCSHPVRIKQKQRQTTWIMDLRINAVPEMVSPYRSVTSVLLNQRGRTGIPASNKGSSNRCNLKHPGK